MNYEDMTDFEINKAVASEIGIYWHSSPSNNNSKSWFYSDNYNECNTSKGEVAIELPDYCNSPADAWPIILENKISIVFDEHETYVNQGVIESYPWVKHERKVKDGESPLRAAMIVYLMMNEDKK